MELRLAIPDDALLLWKWRNDPETRAYSFDASPVSLDQHLKWFFYSLSNPDRFLYVAWEKEVPIGTVRFDKQADSYEISWTIAGEQRKKGWGTKMVGEALKNFQNAKVFCRIKPGNMASYKIAERNNIKVL